MSVVATTEEHTAPSRVARRTTPGAALAALGIVYGDLGTSRSIPCKQPSRRSVAGLPRKPQWVSSR